MALPARKVLVIDNSPENCRQYQTYLAMEEAFAYQILTEPYGNQGLQHYHGQYPDIILLGLEDLFSEDFTLLDQLTQGMGCDCPPVVVIGGHQVTVAVQALKHGAADYLVRDQMTGEDLRHTLRSAIENAELKRQLRISQERFQTSVENLMDCFGIFTAIRDDEGKIVDFRIDYVNQAACENNRMTREQQVGRRLCEVLPGHIDSGLFDAYCHLVETGEPMVKDSVVFEDAYGGPQQLVRAFDIRATRLNDGFVASWRDITRRKRLELELNYTVTSLQQEQQRLRQLIDQAPVGIGIGSPSGEVKVINDALLHLYGLDRASVEPQGMNWRDFIPPHQAKWVQQALEQLQQEGQFPPQECNIMRPNGQRVPLWMSANQLSDGTDDHVAYAIDLTRMKQTQATLRDERKLRRALDSLFSFVGMMTPEGTLVDANRTALEAAGLTLEDVVNRPFEDTYWWSYSPQVQADLRQAIAQAAQGQTVRYDVEVRLKDDQRITIDFALVALFDRDGQVEYLVPSGIDVTRRKQVEASLRESQNQLQQQLAELENIYHSAPIGLNVLDRELRFVRINQRLADINGLSVEDHLGRTVGEVLPDLADIAEQILRPILETGEPLLNVEIHGQTPAQPGVERIWREHFLPLKQGGQVIGINTVCEEITELKRSELERQEQETDLQRALQDIQASETRFRVLAETIQDVFWMTDFRGPKVLYVSPAFETVWGQSPEVVYRDHSVWLQTVHPEDRSKVRDAFTGGLPDEVTELEYRILRPNGDLRWIRDRGFNRQDESGAIQYTVGIAQDITQRKQTELALRQATERLNLALKSTPIVLFNQDRRLRYTWIYNPDPNFQAESVLGRHDAELLDPETAAYLTVLKQQVLDTGVSLREEIEIPSKGQTYHYDLTIDPIRDDQNAIVGITCAAVDISDRIRAEATLRANEQLLRLAMAGANAGSWDWDIPTDTITWSRENCNLYGLDLSHRSPQSEDWYNAIHPDDRERARGEMLRVVEQRQPEFRSEFRIVHPQRGVRWLLGLGRLTTDAQGRPLHLSGINLDITQRKQTEQSLRRSEERYRTLFETMEDGFCVLEMIFDEANHPVDYRFIELNPAFERHTGLYQAEGKTARQLLPELEEHWFEIYGQVALTGEPMRFENGSEVMNRWFEVYAFRLGGSTSRKVALLFKDISDRKAMDLQRERLLQQEQAAREAAERANRIKDEFLAILSHELRSPLNPILGWSKLLQTKPMDPAKTQRALATIERNAKLQTQLIDDLLDIARILRGKLKLNPQPVNLTDVVAAALDTVRTTATTKSISLNFNPPSPGQILNLTQLTVSGDPARLQQIVWNLLSNAIKFTPKGGRVEVRLEQVAGREQGSEWESGSVGEWEDTDTNATRQPANLPTRQPTHPSTSTYAQITITDTGKGISPDFLPHIFESFRQEDVSITRQHGGLGLGLSIVRYLVEAHGGIITADSPGEGQGATFAVKIPVLTHHSGTAAAVSSSKTPSLSGVRVMAVDDEADARNILVAILTYHDAEVMMLATAAEVLAQLPVFRPHVLICDLGMPKTDGYSLIEQVRQQPSERGGQTPAIALTAYAREEDRQRTLNSGFQRHLAKPFDLENLVRAVAQLAGDNC